MGIIRKTTSVYTLGLVDFQSDKERMARSARLTKQAVRKQNRMLKAQANPKPAFSDRPATEQKYIVIATVIVFLFIMYGVVVT